MKVAVIGGTGKMGRALAKQLSRNNRVVIGSRDPARARDAAQAIPGVEGADYAGASDGAEAAVFAIPYPALMLAVPLRKALSGKLVVSAVNPMRLKGGFFEPALEEGSAAEELAVLLPESRLATGFNHIPWSILDAEEVVPVDVLVAADSEPTFEAAAKLVRSIPNIRPLNAGPLSQARGVEAITPLLLNLARLNVTGSLATKFVSGGARRR